ncbi:MAG: ABC transporter permease [Clostridiales bacterium]|jgi:putative ABC transport system permease protein|nr:ABC transporter permease [Clostridiales bacterium]
MLLMKKAFRSMLANRRAYIACVWLLAAGILFFVAMNITIADLRVSREKYYSEYRFADVFAKTRAAPASAVNRLKRLPGVADVSLRRVEDCRVVMDGSDKIITLRVSSVEPGAAEPINGAALSGAFHSDDDLFVAQSFLDAYSLTVGDTLTLLTAAGETRFRIAGTAVTPEYVYTIPSMADILPDPSRFNYAFAAEKPLNTHFGAPNLYNDVGIELTDGYVFDDVEEMLTDELSRYGLISLYERDSQPSAAVVKMEIDSIESMSKVVPFIFCGMAVVILYLMLKRVVEQDRGQIGTLKAFGFGTSGILGHYALYGVVTGGLGGIFGGIGGFFLSGYISDIMRAFFSLPRTRSARDITPIIITGVLIGLASGALGAFMGAFRVVRLRPAEAMKPEAPRVTKLDPLRFLPGLRLMLTATGSMAVRNITRAKVRSLFIIVGTCFSFGMLAFVSSFPTMVDGMLLNQFTKVQLFDLKAAYRSPRGTEAAVGEALRIKGVTEAEAMLEIPATISKNSAKEASTLTGIPEGGRLFRIYDDQYHTYSDPPKNGLILSSTLAERLGASAGDKVTVSSPYYPEDFKLTVAGIVTQSMGTGAYMERGALARAVGMDGLATSVVMKADDVAYVKDALKNGNNIAALTDADESASGFNTYLAMTNSLLIIFFFFGLAVALAIIYNTSTISLSERVREFATLRVLGLTVDEVGRIQSFEYWILTLAGMALGVPFTTVLKHGIDSILEMDIFSLPTYTEPSSYLLALAGVMLAVFVSNLVSRRKIAGFDMVEALKDRE